MGKTRFCYPMVKYHISLSGVQENMGKVRINSQKYRPVFKKNVLQVLVTSKSESRVYCETCH